MKSLCRNKETNYRLVVGKLMVELRLRILDSEIDAAFAELSLPQPVGKDRIYFRKICNGEIERKMQRLCTEFSERFENEPKPRDLGILLDSAGYKYSRLYRAALLKMLKEQNADRWVLAQNLRRRKTVRLAEGELAMWEALQRTYDLNSEMLVPTLLRLFTVLTSTGKINPIEVPYLTSSITDRQLKKYAQLLNFIIKKTGKPRV